MFSMAINHNRARRTQALAIRKHHGSSRVCRQTHAHSHTHTYRHAYGVQFLTIRECVDFFFFCIHIWMAEPNFFFHRHSVCVGNAVYLLFVYESRQACVVCIGHVSGYIIWYNYCAYVRVRVCVCDFVCIAFKQMFSISLPGE